MVSSSGSDPNHYKFDAKERDTESNLDEFGARYYASTYGRFMTPDWAEKPTDVPYANFGNPQTLNLYAYVRNNPASLGDAEGHDWNDIWQRIKNCFKGFCGFNDEQAKKAQKEIDRQIQREREQIQRKRPPLTVWTSV